MADDVQWWARTLYVKRMGPYPNQIAASEAVKGHDGDPVPGSFTWPEYRQESELGSKRKKKRRAPA